MDFVKQPKIYRLNREVIVTEKIDGTNAAVAVDEDGTVEAWSKNRKLSPGTSDNFGFRKWAEDNREGLTQLGPGIHRGEWWGCGIQRGYGQTGRHFSLFNVGRWSGATPPPLCCSVVPILGVLDSLSDRGGLNAILEDLRRKGSWAALLYPKPEGVVLYHVPSGNSYKVTLEGDESPKGNQR